MQIAEIIHNARMRTRSVNYFGTKADPILDEIFKFFRRERLHLSWKKVVLLGCSAGGNVALRTLFKQVQVPHVPILIAMHHKPGFDFMIKFEMGNGVFQRIVPARDGEAIRGSLIYFIPGEYETGFSPGTRSFKMTIPSQPPRFRPEIDRIFVAAGACFRQNLMGVILSGMLYDGAEGAKAVYLNRGEVWVQDPLTALFKDMPATALKVVPQAQVTGLTDIAERINQLSQETLSIEPVC